jgi:hypothetical protein
MPRAAIIAALLRGGSSIPAGSMVVGYNIGGSNYYSGYGFFADYLFGAYKLPESTTGGVTTVNAVLANGQSITYNAITHYDADLLAWKPGNYVLTWPAGVTASVGLFGSNTSAGTSGRYVFAIPLPSETGELEKLDPTNQGGVYVTLTNGTGSTVDCRSARLCHVDDETAVMAGAVLSAEAAEALRTASNGPLRTLNLNGANALWIQAVEDIPADDEWGSRTAYSCQVSSGVTQKFTGYTNYGVSPERIGRIGTQVGRPLWVNLPVMMTDAACTAYLTRLASTYPSGAIYIEAGNECIISPQFAPNAGYLGSGMYHANQALSDPYLGSYPIGTDNGDRRAEALAHCSLRFWKIAETVFGRSRVRRALNMMLVSPSQGAKCMEYVDPGIITAGQKVAQLIDETKGDCASVSAYFGTIPDSHARAAPSQGGGEFPLFNNDPAGFHMSTRWAVKNKAYNQSDATIKGQMKNSANQAAGYVKDYNDWCTARGYERVVTAVYEGLWGHWDDGRSGFEDIGGMMLAYDVTTGDMIGTTSTINGVTYTDNAEAVADWYEDGDVVRATWVSTPGGGLADSTNYLCKVVAGKLRLYTTQANYNAGTQLTGGTSQRVALWNASRTNRLLLRRNGLLTSSAGLEVLEYWVSVMSAQGINLVNIFAFSGNANKLGAQQGGGGVYSSRPWSVTNKGGWDTAGNSAITWARNRA